MCIEKNHQEHLVLQVGDTQPQPIAECGRTVHHRPVLPVAAQVAHQQFSGEVQDAPQARRVMNLCPCEGGFPDTRPGLLRERFALARREQFVDERLVAHEGDIHGVLLV